MGSPFRPRIETKEEEEINSNIHDIADRKPGGGMAGVVDITTSSRRAPRTDRSKAEVGSPLSPTKQLKESPTSPKSPGGRGMEQSNFSSSDGVPVGLKTARERAIAQGKQSFITTSAPPPQSEASISDTSKSKDLSESLATGVSRLKEGQGKLKKLQELSSRVSKAKVATGGSGGGGDKAGKTSNSGKKKISGVSTLNEELQACKGSVGGAGLPGFLESTNTSERTVWK